MIGLSYGFHDAALTVVTDRTDEIAYASQSERYSRIKNDKWLAPGQIDEIGSLDVFPSEVVYYERPLVKRSRQFIYGQPHTKGIMAHAGKMLGPTPIRTVDHHHSHAAAGYYTSPFTDAAVVVIDAIGEWDTISTWVGQGRNLKCVDRTRYPHSLGLLYSAFTKRIGLKPNEDEYILMGLAGYGDPIYVDTIMDEFVSLHNGVFRLKQNVHRGIGDWLPHASDSDLAASIQRVLEICVIDLFKKIRRDTGRRNLVYQGGVALNCTLNAKLASEGIFDDIWIMPNPGDAGASLGAALAVRSDFVEWKTPFLGTNIDVQIDPVAVVAELAEKTICGIAHGRAEFGPRALGNRSLLGDPRMSMTKTRLNEVKMRQAFRPFAPIVLKEYADEFFEMAGLDCRYMQYAVKCRKPDVIPAAVHADGTSRVQTVGPDDGTIYAILKGWYELTNCPVLLNTSLNIKGEPLVNNRTDADAFERKHEVRVF